MTRSVMTEGAAPAASPSTIRLRFAAADGPPPPRCARWRITYFSGSPAVNGEQQGGATAWNSMISARVPSGS
jgi:hypothetical protein